MIGFPRFGGGLATAAAALLSLLSLSSLLDTASAECKYLHVNITETMVMKEFLFIAGTTDCINVKVYYSDTEPADTDITTGNLDPATWEMMCDSTVTGKGSGDHTVLPAEDCVGVPVTEGETVWFYFSIEPATGCGLDRSLTHELLTTTGTVYQFCPADNLAHLPEFMQTASPTTSPVQSVASQGTGPTSPIGTIPLGPTPTSSPTVSNMPTFKPTVSRAPTTQRPTRAPITAKPTGAVRYTINVPTDTPGGYIDPSGEIKVAPNSSVTFTFFPQICLETDTVATGILYGHFDADYMAGFDPLMVVAPNEITFTPGTGVYGTDWGPGTGDTGSYSYPTGTDAHDHEYDEDCDCVYVDYIRPSASMERMRDIMKKNIIDADGWAGTDLEADKARDDMVWKLIAANGDINTAGFFVVNDVFNHYDPTTFHSVVTWDDMDVDDLPMFTWGDPTDPNWNPSMTDPALRAQVVQITEIAMGYKYDAIRRGPGGILPTNTGDMKGNTPGQYSEWRNGALTMQVVKVSSVDGSFHCTMKPEWSNSSRPMYPGDPDRCHERERTTQGPVSQCEAGYNVLYEGTLFWHWSGGCNSGGPSYHASDWTPEYHAYFTEDCLGPDENGNVCVFNELCYVLVDGKEACLTDANQVTIDQIDGDHDIEALFMPLVLNSAGEKISQCPDAPVTAAPTISAQPTISFSPTAAPTISQAPTDKFLMDVRARVESSDTVGQCWRWAHTWHCYEDSSLVCQQVTGTDAANVFDPTSATTGKVVADDNCCPNSGIFANHEDVAPDCITMTVSTPTSNDLGQCFYDLTSADGKPNLGGQNLLFEFDSVLYPDAYAVKIEVSPDHICSSCYLTGAEALLIDTSKAENDNRHLCPAEGINPAWADFGGWGTMDLWNGKMSKKFGFLFKGDKTKHPVALAANMWCGSLSADKQESAQGCTLLPPEELGSDGKGYRKNG